LQLKKIHILGAPGSGVTTLGKALAERLGFSHFDTDDYVWFTGDDLPYRRKRNPEHRRQLLQLDLEKSDTGVLSGALCGWGDVFVPKFEMVVYLWLPVEVRLARIRERETRRYGAERLAAGGDLHLVFEKFLTWSANYDVDNANIRSRASELRWLQQLTCPVLKIEEEMPVEELVEFVLKNLSLEHLTS
jgi:adenylate kinase family enzyme